MTNTNEEKIYDFFNKDFIKNISDIAILKQDDGSYELFDKYFIKGSKSDGYSVSVKHSFTTVFFYSLKNAVTWCIFQKRNKVREASRIEHLDKSLESIRNMIVWHKTLIEKVKDPDTKLIYLAKLSYDDSKKRSLIKELNSFLLEGKGWQNNRLSHNVQK